MAIGFSEWDQRNSDTERRTFWPNLWECGGFGLGWPSGLPALAPMKWESGATYGGMTIAATDAKPKSEFANSCILPAQEPLLHGMGRSYYLLPWSCFGKPFPSNFEAQSSLQKSLIGSPGATKTNCFGSII